MVDGRVPHRESLADMRSRAARELSSLPPRLREIGVRGETSTAPYEVRPSPRLLAALDDAREQVDVSGEGMPVGDS
jgi:hypothetical protein